MTVTEVAVRAAQSEYPVRIGAGVLQTLGQCAPAPGKVALISDESVFALHGKAALDALGKKSAAEIIIKPGEEQKTTQTLNAALDAMIEANIGRDGWAAALGGGVVGDLAGFAAAVYLRGIPVVQIPTTLLAQVDAAVGGKTGVNHRLGKNLIGAFHQPAAVLCDTQLLSTLPAREYRAGLAEVVKYGMLGGGELFSFLEKNAEAIIAREPQTTAHIVCESVKMKAQIVAADERETGGARALLNLGHTFAHAIETADGYGKWLHGEAVAMGLIAAAKLSENIAGLKADVTVRARELLQRFNLPVCGVSANAEELFSAMARDKKCAGGERRVVVLRAFGKADVTVADEKDIKSAAENIIAK